MARIIQVSAPHFVAAVVLTDDRVTEAAPILKYMVGWPRSRVFGYCARKGWKAHQL